MMSARPTTHGGVVIGSTDGRRTNGRRGEAGLAARKVTEDLSERPPGPARDVDRQRDPDQHREPRKSRDNQDPARQPVLDSRPEYEERQCERDSQRKEPEASMLE